MSWTKMLWRCLCAATPVYILTYHEPWWVTAIAAYTICWLVLDIYESIEARR